jgi:hypothetical protein
MAKARWNVMALLRDRQRSFLASAGWVVPDPVGEPIQYEAL